MRILFILFILINYSMLQAQVNKNLVDTICKYMRDCPAETELSIAFTENGKQTFFGVKRTGDTISIVENNHSLFEIGSNSKVFTAILLAQLVNEKALSLADPVSKFYPFALKQAQKDSVEVNLMHLANHTSGVPRLPSNINSLNITNPYADYDTIELNTYLREKMKLLSKPGVKCSYSNLGYALLGDIVSRTAGMSYEQLIKSKICTPLGLNETTISLTEQQKNILVPGRDHKGKIVSNWNFKVFAAAGAIKSTSHDMIRFIEENINLKSGLKPALELCQVPTFKESDRMSVGLGWHIINKEKKRVYFHNGGTGGYTSAMLFNPDAKKGVVVLSNISALSKNMGIIDQLAFNLLKNGY